MPDILSFLPDILSENVNFPVGFLTFSPDILRNSPDTLSCRIYSAICGGEKNWKVSIFGKPDILTLQPDILSSRRINSSFAG